MFEIRGELEGGHRQDHTTVLAEAVRGYPMGIGLVKEFLQNADDAGATELRVVYDRRRHPGPCSPDGSDSALDVVLEPALLFINDTVFTEDDLKGIRNIGKSVKFTRASGTGRFGKGFCTAFSVSDHPTILTDTNVMWFDPHHHAICSSELTRSDTNMRRFTLQAATEQLPNWTRTFAVPGVNIGQDSCAGTIFRLPLRNEVSAPHSEISHQVFTDEVWERIVTTTRRIGPALLVFLRSIESLLITEIDEDGIEHTKLEIVTNNGDRVRNARAPLHMSTDGETVLLLEQWLDGSAPLPTAIYEHEFIVTDGGDDLHEEAWTIVTGLLPGPDNCLLKHAHKVCTAEDPDKVLPWAGAAVCLATTRKDALLGGRSCFLPVGDQSHPPPVWIHGWFDLDTNRSHLTRDFGGEGNASNRALWNQQLLEHGVGPLWARLIERLGDRPHELAGDGYRLWTEPPEDNESLESALSIGFYKAATELAIMRVRSGDGHEMRAPDDQLRYLPRTIKPALEAGLIEDNVPFYDPRPPEQVRHGLEGVDVKLKPLTPNDLRNHFDELELLGNADTWSLDDVPSTLLRGRERIEAIWAFFAQSPTTTTDLIETPLCLTFEDRLRCFNKDELVYTCTEEQEEILQTLPHRRLHPDCQDALNLGERETALGVSPIDIGNLPEFLGELVERDGEITDDWAAAVLDDLVRRSTTELERELETLHKLPLLPTHVGSRTPLGYLQTAALVRGSTDNAPEALLERLCVPIVRGSTRLHASVATALDHCPRMMRVLSPQFAARVLALGHPKFFDPPEHAERLAALDVQQASELLTYLAQIEWDLNDSTDKKVLLGLRSRLPLITSQGTLTRADADNVYRPTGAQPPAELEAGVIVLDVSGDGWAGLASALGVEELDDATLMLQHALPFLNSPADDAAKHKVCLWLLRQAPAVLDEPEDEEDGGEKRARELRKALRAAPLLPLRGGGTGSADTVYRTNSDEGLERLTKVLGENIAIVPLKAPAGLKHSQWSTALDALGVPLTPRASDILRAILDASADWADPELREQALYRLRNTYAFLNEPGRLENLKEQKLTGVVIKQATEAVCSNFSDPHKLAQATTFQMHWKSNPPKLMVVLKALRWLPAQPRMWAAEEDDFTQRLFAPTELSPPAQRPRVSAVRPVLALAEPNKELREDLGLQSAGASEMDEAEKSGPIGEQLCALQLQDPGSMDEATLDDFKKTVNAVYTQVANLSDPETALKKWHWPHVDEGLEVCVLVEREWRHPRTVFFNRLDFPPNPWIGSITGWEERALSLQRPFLEAIGVRDLPEPADWVRMLSGLRELAEDRPLTGTHLGLANRALRALATELKNGSVEACGPMFVLSDVDGLIDAEESYELDSSRLQGHRDGLDLPIIKREEDNRRVARWAGVQPISKVVTLGNPQGPIVEDYSEPDRAKSLLRLVVERPDIWGTLVARLRYHYALKSDEDTDIELATVREWQEEAVELGTALCLTVYKTLTVELSFAGINHEPLSLTERYFIDHENAAVHITEDELDYSLEEALAALALGGDISSAEAAEAGKILLRVARAPDDLRVILDRLDIAYPPDETLIEEDPSDEVTESPSEQWSSDDSAVDGDEGPSEEASQGTTDCETADAVPGVTNSGSGHGDAGGDDQSGDDHASAVTTVGEHGQSSTATDGEASRDATNRRDTQKTDGTDATKSNGTTPWQSANKGGTRNQKGKKGRKWREPGDRKASTDQPNSDTTSKQSRSQSRPRDRMTSYVTREDTTQERRHRERQEWEQMAEAGRLGEAAVLKHELRKGWSAVEIGGNNPGYDIASSPSEGEDGPDMNHPDARYIEVKATQHGWDAYGVAISETQFKMARDPDKHSRWWLYVIEHVDTPAQHIHEVPNPVVNLGLQFRFDGGWAKWAERERTRRTTPIPQTPNHSDREGKRFRLQHPSGKILDFTVIRIVHDVASKRLSAQVLLDSGEKRTLHNLDSWEPLD